MRSPALHRHFNLTPMQLYRVFKYSVYCLLAANVFFFFIEEASDSLELYGLWLPWPHIAEAYSSTIDTLAWVMLLLLFELETAIIADEQLKGGLRWGLTGLRSLSYLVILYAFYGYCVQYGVVTDTVPFITADVCRLVDTEYRYMRVDNYAAITPDVCLAMQGQPLVRIAGTPIISTVPAMQQAVHLALVDIINAGDWLIVVLLLEAEVYLQSRHRLTRKMAAAGKLIKAVVYSILFACALYWGIYGEFLDFWDAFLWLLAFLFIELNILKWHLATGAESKQP